ncbi:Type I secretion system membrane fusion protein PrsE [Roseovarius albus]|uniref:Membrane fusion protein (MFP) family protein n=1 Tax=Roseovarius albus TaxID=1247867 RepID=A0A1X6YVJ0_9RHOB|nr:HlyD family type I secretion periplasmic adaptor subunit [Roseovarius albus]SLN32421.1 Type I secretion system membrane fusion protein PrsE [Roseovarius albus]
MQEPDPVKVWRATGPLVAGAIALVALIGGLGVWSIKARLSGAVVSQGMIEVETNRQVVQHPDGGVVGAILIDESDEVRKGDILIRLDGRQLRSELAIVNGQLYEIATRKSRLEAERDSAGEIEFPPELLEIAKRDEEIDRMMQGGRTLFEARKQSLEQEARLLSEQNNQIDKRIEGINAQLDSLQVQSDLMQSELDGQKELLKNQLIQASRVNELKREHAGLTGQIGRLEAEIAELRGQATSNDIALLQLKTERREEAVTTLRDLQFREIELVERRIDLEDTLSRLDIRSPMDGIVYNLQVFAEQSVVRAAEPLLYIIPQDQDLIVSTKIEAVNVNNVYVGQEASLRFPGLDQSEIPELRGEVTRVSADVVKDENTGMNYYNAEIMPFEEELAKLGDEKLLPGMPVDTFIETTERSALAYLIEPMTVFFRRAFRE